MSTLQDSKKPIVVWSYEEEKELLQILDPHLRVLECRLNNQYPLVFARYLKRDSEDKPSNYSRGYDSWLDALERAVMFLPCLSPAFFTQFAGHLERDSRLSKLLTRESLLICSLPLRPLCGVLTCPTIGSNVAPTKFLSGCKVEYEQEQVAARIMEHVEARLRQKVPSAPAVPSTLTLLLDDVIHLDKHQL